MAQRNKRTNRNRDYRDNFEYRTNSRARTGNGEDFEDVSSYSSSKAYGRRQKKKPGKTVAKTLFAVLFAVLIICGAVLIYVSTYLLDGLTTNSITKDTTELGVHSDAVTSGDVKNIALFGLDDRGDSNVGRSDALMILTVDNKNNKMKMTSILRDSLVSIDGYGQDKIAHAYAYGGPELAIKTINQNYKLDITDYVTVNFYQMAKIVDAFGGTYVHISEEEAYEINSNLDLLVFDDSNAVVYDSDYIYTSGDVLLNGNQAVAYSRIRHVGNDEARAERQQNVMKGLVTRIKDLGVTDYPGLARGIMPMCETSLDFWEIAGLAPFMLKSFETDSLSVPGEHENPQDGYTDIGAWVYIYDLDAASRHISSFIYETESPYYTEFTQQSTALQ